MKTKTIFSILLAIIALALPCSADERRQIFDVVIPFEVGAVVTTRTPDGSVREIGTVAMLPEATRWPSYTASAWGTPGAVTATAVNAVHLLISVEDGQGRTMSVIPRNTIAPAAGAGAAVVLEMKAGTGFFGAWAPPVGTEVSVVRGGRTFSIRDELPREGDELLFRVYEDVMPYMVDIENRPGGRVVSWSDRGGPSVIARVIHPVAGCGRFGGTLFQDAGRIRANHSGVIDVSTCPYGETGGFQIIPWDHAKTSKEMQGAWDATQWLIIAPEDGESDMGGTWPLFSGGLVPGSAADEELWDVWSTYGRKPLVLARVDGGEWRTFPTASGKDDHAFKSVTHIRIYFPTTREPGI